MKKLFQKKCIPCDSSTASLKTNEVETFLLELGDDWQLIEQQYLKREFKFPNFRIALDFANKIGKIAEEENHHPDIFLSWGKVEVKIWTHSINGLSENDFILAAKISLIV